jgi:ferric-dicitrate binding protein FerR (iron transport regulator)
VSKFTRALAATMVCLLPVSMMQAEIQGAMLYSRGMVKVNGAIARASLPIKAGDSLQTSVDGTAQIVAEGSFIQLQSGSSLTYDRSSVTLQDGVATIASSSNLSGSVSSLHVSPVSASGARFVLRNQAGRVQVAALMGNVMIKGNNAFAMELKAGNVYTLDANSDNTTTTAPSPDPQASSGTSFSADAGLTFGVTAAIIAGVVLGVINAKSVSPAGP